MAITESSIEDEIERELASLDFNDVGLDPSATSFPVYVPRALGSSPPPNEASSNDDTINSDGKIIIMENHDSGPAATLPSSPVAAVTADATGSSALMALLSAAQSNRSDFKEELAEVAVLVRHHCVDESAQKRAVEELNALVKGDSELAAAHQLIAEETAQERAAAKESAQAARVSRETELAEEVERERHRAEVVIAARITEAKEAQARAERVKAEEAEHIAAVQAAREADRKKAEEQVARLENERRTAAAAARRRAKEEKAKAEAEARALAEAEAEAAEKARRKADEAEARKAALQKIEAEARLKAEREAAAAAAVMEERARAAKAAREKAEAEARAKAEAEARAKAEAEAEARAKVEAEAREKAEREMLEEQERNRCLAEAGLSPTVHSPDALARISAEISTRARNWRRAAAGAVRYDYSSPEYRRFVGAMHICWDAQRLEHIEGVRSHPWVTHLSARDNFVTSTVCLGDCAMLLRAHLSNNRISAARGLRGCGLLTELDLSNNRLEDTPDVTALPLLRKLCLAQNRLRAWSPGNAAWLPCLETLDLSNNHIVRVEGLNACTHLRALYLDNNRLVALRDLLTNTVGCLMLETLSLEGNDSIPPAHVKALSEFRPWLHLSRDAAAAAAATDNNVGSGDSGSSGGQLEDAAASAVAEGLADNPDVAAVLEALDAFGETLAALESALLTGLGNDPGLCGANIAEEAALSVLTGAPLPLTPPAELSAAGRTGLASLQVAYLQAHIRLRRTLEGMPLDKMTERESADRARWLAHTSQIHPREIASAVRIQAWWRGTRVRLALIRALDRVPFHDADPCDYEEIDLRSFDFDESLLDAEMHVVPPASRAQETAIAERKAAATAAKSAANRAVVVAADAAAAAAVATETTAKDMAVATSSPPTKEQSYSETPDPKTPEPAKEPHPLLADWRQDQRPSIIASQRAAVPASGAGGDAGRTCAGAEDLPEVRPPSSHASRASAAGQSSTKGKKAATTAAAAWGLSDPHTVELMRKRAERMRGGNRKKKALRRDPVGRLELLNRAELSAGFTSGHSAPASERVSSARLRGSRAAAAPKGVGGGGGNPGHGLRLGRSSGAQIKLGSADRQRRAPLPARLHPLHADGLDVASRAQSAGRRGRKSTAAAAAATQSSDGSTRVKSAPSATRGGRSR
eukprot:UC1_evm3s2053